MEKHLRQLFNPIKLTTANPEKKVYSRENLPKERMASLYRLLAELEFRLTFSRRTLSTKERKSYVDAVLCLRSVKPALYEDEVPGTSSRYDDFQAVHINQSFIIHVDVCISTAHRNHSF